MRTRRFKNIETGEIMDVSELDLIKYFYDSKFEEVPIMHIEEYGAGFGVRVYYVGQKIGHNVVKGIKNCSLPEPEEQSFQLIGEDGEKFMTITGYNITKYYDFKNLGKKIELAKEYHQLRRQITKVPASYKKLFG